METRIQKQMPIAVIGMGCHYPGAPDLKTLWENIITARRQFRRFPEQRLSMDAYHDADRKQVDKTYASQVGVIDGFEFDWMGYRVPKKTIENTDIVHWLTYEVALRAVKDAGYKKGEFPKETTGVILGNTLTGEQTRSVFMRQRWPFVEKTLAATAKDCGFSDSAQQAFIERTESYYKSVFPAMTEDSLAGGLSNTIAGRVCNVLDINGGGYTVDGACASSLIAVATAAEKLAHGVLDVVIAGGVDVSLDTFEMVGFARTGALTPDEMRVYDKRGNGFMPGEGCGLLILKRLQDAERDGDKVYATLQGWGISSDGKGGITAPNGVYQGLALKRAYDLAPYQASALDFIEGHGTGTTVGDREELKGIAQTVGTGENAGLRSCGVTSFKSIVGHTKAAAGAGGLIKAVLAVNQRVIPPTGNCEYPNAYFDTPEGRNIYPVLLGQRYPVDKIMRAGVSAMGFGGINTHVTLESGDIAYEHISPNLPAPALLASTQKTELFPLAAATPADLLLKARQLKTQAFGMSIAELADLAAQWSHTELTAYGTAVTRAVAIASHPKQLNSQLTTLINHLAQNTEQNTLSDGQETELIKQQLWLSQRCDKKRLGFVFPGQGSQQLNMGRKLLQRYDWAADKLQIAENTLQQLGWAGAEGLGDIIQRPTDRASGNQQLSDWKQTLTATQVAQPAICLTSALWHERLQRLGLNPVVTGGHSLGELNAFHAAGAFDFPALIKLAGIRGHAMQQADTAGGMLALMCDVQKAELLVNAATDYVVIANINHPGQTVVSGTLTGLEQVQTAAQNAGISALTLPVSNAFHSRLVADAAEVLLENNAISGCFDAHTPVISAVSANLMQSGMPLPRYFANQITARVNFVGLVQEMSHYCDMIVEVGPGAALSKMTQQTLSKEGILSLPVESTAMTDDDLNILLARYFCRGGSVNWEALYESRLIRPFVPATEKTFISNPCEAPFVVEEAPAELMELFRTSTTTPPLQPTPNTDITSKSDMDMDINTNNRPGTVTQTEALLMQLVEEATGFPQESLSNDLRLLDDLNLDSIKAAELIGEAATALQLQAELDPAPLANASLLEIAQALNGTSDLHQEITNTAPPALSTITTSLVEASDATSPTPDTGNAQPPVTTELTPALQPNTKVTNASSTVEAIILELIEASTGFPVSSLSNDLRLLDDLNLDSIKAAELIGEAATRLELQEVPDPAPLANASIAEVAMALSSPAASQATCSSQLTDCTNTPLMPDSIGNATEITANVTPITATIATTPASTTRPPLKVRAKAVQQPWVRNFIMTPVTALLSESSDTQLEHGKDALIICENTELDIAQAVASQLKQSGIQTQGATFQTLSQHPSLLKATNLQYIVIILPRAGDTSDDAEQLQRMVNRLHSISGLKADKQPLTVSFVQFAGGRFATDEAPATLAQCGSLALASSLHLEKKLLNIRVLDFTPQTEATDIADKISIELAQPGNFIAAGYDSSLNRSVLRPELHQPALDKPRDINWTAQDVILVTGGAKGITAECALAFAKATGVKMALVGSSPAPAAGTDHEINTTLQHFTNNGLQARYYACNLTEQTAVNATLNHIQQEMGQVTGIIHGAAINKPRPLSYVSATEALQEVSPKVLGAMHLSAAFTDKPLKLFAALTSIIGVTGMIGNGWYGFSNEVLDLILGQYAARHPDTQVISTAFSVWGDVGMGARMGSTDYLAQMGIMSIPTQEGITRFTDLLLNECQARQVVVCAQLAGLDTWQVPAINLPEQKRYLENIIYSYAGVEVTSQAHLTLEKDAYVKDHVWKGSYLFPTVFGLEAMAQAVAAVTGIKRFRRLRIENIRLERPIVVNKNHGVTIQIQARVAEASDTDTKPRMKVSISTEQSQFRTSHFSAEFVIGGAEQLLARSPEGLPAFPEQALPIDPKADMYSWLLFQGPSFQRLQQFYRVDNDYCLFSTAAHTGEEQQWVLGSPYVRDSLLQSVQPMVPQHICLPVCIDALNIRDCGAVLPENLRGVSANLGLANEEYKTMVYALDDQGQLLESLENYQLRILEYRNEFPADKAYAEPKQFEENTLQQRAAQAAAQLGITLPTLTLHYIPNLAHIPKHERRELLKTLVNQWQQSLGQTLSVDWMADGKPVLRDGARVVRDTGLSISHQYSHLLLASGPGEQGCDIEMISERSRNSWKGLLGIRDAASAQALEDLLTLGERLSVAGTRLWTLKEAAFKASGEFGQQVTILRSHQQAVLFAVKTATGHCEIVTFPVDLLRGGQKMVAIVVATNAPAGAGITVRPPQRDNSQPVDPLQSSVLQAKAMAAYNAATGKSVADDLLIPREELETIGYQPDHYLISMRPANDRQNVPVFVIRTPLYFKDTQNLSRGVYFANYFLWMGKIREAATYPIMAPMSAQLVTGEWGLVTNSSSIEVLGEATTGDVVETHFWMGRVLDSNNSTFDLFYDWRKLETDGSHTRLAKGKMRASWVRILDHGLVTPEPLPEYFDSFVEQMQPSSGEPQVFEAVSEPLADLNWGVLEHQATAGPRPGYVLAIQDIQTSLDDANSVGNVYFSNYARWQGQIRDQFFYELAPDYFRGIGEKGELVTISCEVDHLREAMPFDVIRVEMRISILAEKGAELRFAYYRITKDDTRTKLAVGSQIVIWATKNASGEFGAMPWPDVFKAGLSAVIPEQDDLNNVVNLAVPETTLNNTEPQLVSLG